MSSSDESVSWTSLWAECVAELNAGAHRAKRARRKCKQDPETSSTVSATPSASSHVNASALATDSPSVSMRSELQTDKWYVQVKDRNVELLRSSSKRASRSCGSDAAAKQGRLEVQRLIEEQRCELEDANATILCTEKQQKRRKVYGTCTSKAPALRAQDPLDKDEAQHFAHIKSESFDCGRSEAKWLLNGRTVPLQHDELAEAAFKSNAVSSSVTKMNRKVTESARLQTSRISCRPIGQAAAAQCTKVWVVQALAEATARLNGLATCSPVDASSTDPCELSQLCTAVRGCAREAVNRQVCVIQSTSQLIYNSNSIKLGPESIYSVAKQLARLELEQEQISQVIPSANHMLKAICHSVQGGFELDAAWAAVVLIVYVISDPRSRNILRNTGITDWDVHNACAIEAYGRGEITRRSRMRLAKNEKRTLTSSCNYFSENDEDDSDVDFMDGDICSSLALQDEGDAARILSAKRRRIIRGASALLITDSYSLLHWWFRALRCPDRSVLTTLMAENQNASKLAAAATLDLQTSSKRIARDDMLVCLATTNAYKSSCTILKMFLDRDVDDVPRWVSMNALQNGNKDTKFAFAHNATLTSGSTLHAASLPPRNMQASKDSELTILWSCAVHEMTVDGSHHVPQTMRGGVASTRTACVTAHYKEIAAAKLSRKLSMDGKQKRRGFCDTPQLRRIQRLTEHIKRETTAAMPSAASGVTRSFIVFKTSIQVTTDVFESSQALYKELEEFAKQSKALSQHTPNEPLMCIPTGEYRKEPLCVPALKLTIGLQLSELIRRAMGHRTRKNDLCRVQLSDACKSDLLGFELIVDSEPPPLAVITDFNINFDDSTVSALDKAFRNTSVGTTAPKLCSATIGLHVGIHKATRVTEMIIHEKNVWHQRALLYTGSSQASYIGDFGSNLAAGSTNSCINSSRRICCADVNVLALLSIADVFGGAITNVKPSQSGPYYGVYGPRLDTGITSCGSDGHYHRSDRRAHGSMMLGHEVASEVAHMLAKMHFVEDENGNFVERPSTTRGIPYGFIPGIHSLLTDYENAISNSVVTEEDQHADCNVGGCTNTTMGGLFCLPISKFTQALRPDVESTVDPTHRFAFRDPTQSSAAVGRSYMSDVTSEDDAIVTEPLFRRPCVATIACNPFATSYEYVDSCFNVLGALAIIARIVGGVDALWRHLDEWHSEEPGEPTGSCRGSWLWASDACVLLFGVLYPNDHRVAQEVVPTCYANACAKNARLARQQIGDANDSHGQKLHALVSPEEAAQARGLWARMRRKDASLCPWQSAIAPFLQLLIEQDGNHCMWAKDVQAYRRHLNCLCSRAAWLFYSEDGKTPPLVPNPAANCRTADDVRRPTLDPVFTGRGVNLQHAQPRGCLVGLKPFQLRQIYALLLGAHLDGVKVQAVRNEGGLLLRESARSTVHECDGSKRSRKGISFTQTDGDDAAYGTRRAKVYGADLQRVAWDANVLLQAPLYCAVEPPRDILWRTRGMHGDPQRVREMIAQGANEGISQEAQSDLERWAAKRFEAAASSALNDSGTQV